MRVVIPGSQLVEQADMVERARKLRRIFTRRYVLGLSIIAILASVSLAVIYVLTQREESRASVLSLANGQQALSQRIAFHANALAGADTPHERAELRLELDASIRAMTRAHDLLTGAEAAPGIATRFLVPMREIYFDDAEPFDVEVRRFLSLARVLIDADAAGEAASGAVLQELNLLARSSIMQTHHMMSLMMEREATRSVLAAEMIQTVLWALILLAIAIEAPLIFNPMGREIEASLQAADSAEMAASEEARRLREAYEAKSEFLRVMSHELRTPLNAIIGLTDLLSQDPPDETRREYIDHVRGAGDHMLQLVNDVLDDGRIAAGKLLLQPKPTAVRDVVVGVAAMLKERAEVKGLVLTARGEDAAKLDIDAARLRQVLINLVGNGVKFTDAGSVAIEFEQSPADDDGAVVEIRVRDTGAGIPEEKLGSIFKEYEQLEGANAKELGTGLGLSICRKIIDAFEGEIVVESALGVGSLFTVRFAARLSASADGPEDAGSAPVAAKGEGRVLIVDDNLTNRLIVRAFLEDAGYAVLQAENGAQAIDLCVAVEDIDAVLMDIDMPVMRGDEAIWRLRAMGGRFAALSIFALTANVLPEDQKKLIEAGADGVIFKPIRRDVLTARLAGEAGPASFQAAS